MGKYLLTFILGLVAYPLARDCINFAEYTANTEWEWNRGYNSFATYGVFDFAMRRCTKEEGKNGHGWTFVVREYHECGTLSVYLSDLLYGEKSN